MKKDIDGVYIPFGIKIAHTWHEIGAIFQIIEDYGIEFVVELGTFQGGLTLLLEAKRRFNKKFDYISVEVDRNLIHPLTQKFCPSIYLGDCFHEGVVDHIKEQFEGKRTLIYCDNGNKVKEMKLYSQVLNFGDIIMCHDYYDGQRVYEISGYGEDLEFPVPEVSYEDLDFLDRSEFRLLPLEYLEGTRIVGFIKI